MVNKVIPGDLITADLMNELLSRVGKLETDLNGLAATVANLAGRVAALEGESLVVTGIAPDPVRAGARLDISGTGFEGVVTRGSVVFGDIPIVRFPEATPNKLAFVVPTTLTGLPSDVALVLQNGVATVNESVRVLPAQPSEEGRVTVQDVTGELQDILVGSTYVLKFSIRSGTRAAEAYRVDLTYGNVTGTVTAREWTAGTVATLQDGRPVPAELTVSPDAPQVVVATVKIPSGAVAATLTVTATSIRNPGSIISTPASITLTVGAAPPVNDPRTTFGLVTPGPTSPIRAIVIDGKEGREFPYSTDGTIRVEVSVRVAGRYSYSATLLPDQGRWSTPNVQPPDSREDAVGGAGLYIQLRLPAPDDGTKPLETRTLRITATRNPDDAGGAGDPNRESFESWIDLPIQGEGS